MGRQKIKVKYGEIYLPEGHPYSGDLIEEGLSPYVQSQLMYLVTHMVYSLSKAMAERLLGVKVSESQLHRIAEKVGEKLEIEKIEGASDSLKEVLSDKKEVVYGLVDGSMIPMKEGWQEVKLGRVFSGRSEWKSGEISWEKGLSEYVGLRGSSEAFGKRFEELYPPSSACIQVLLSDGATWIRQWIASRYPQAAHILDIYHVLEKIGKVNAEKAWIDLQKERLMEGKHQEVVKAVKSVKEVDKKEKAMVVKYLMNNKEQMQYEKYIGKGYMIGSGAIESAHRSVIQSRMKLSGQHWSEKGADKMILFRTAFASGKYYLIDQIFDTAFQ